MAPDWLYIFVGASVLTLVGFIFFSVLWLRRLRDTVLLSLSEVVSQQVFTAQRTSDVLTHLQKQQDYSSKQLLSLAKDGLRLQKELSIVAHKLNDSSHEPVRVARTLH